MVLPSQGRTLPWSSTWRTSTKGTGSPGWRARRGARPRRAGRGCLDAGEGAEGVGLGHAPGVRDLQPVALAEALDHRGGRGRAADDHRAHGREVQRFGSLIEQREDAQPDGGDARGEGHRSARHEVEQRRRGRGAAPGRPPSLPSPPRRTAAPRVGVEHRHHRQQRVGLGDAERVGHARDERVEHRRAVAVRDALGVARSCPRCNRSSRRCSRRAWARRRRGTRGRAGPRSRGARRRAARRRRAHDDVLDVSRARP
jgi:hypothetical protein